MATISSLGIGSGLDLNSLLDQLKSAEQEKLTPITNQQTSYKAKLSAFGQLESALDKLQTSAKALGNAETFQAVTSSVTGSAVTVSTDSEAVPGRYEVSVTQLARAQTLASQGVEKTDPVGAGTLTFNKADGSSFDVTLGAEDSLEDLRDAINDQKAGISATIINDGSADRLVLTSENTGTESQLTGIVDNRGASTDFSYSGGSDVVDAGMDQKVAAQNAQLTVNGIDIASASNTVEGAVQGVTLELSSETEGTSDILTVSRDSKTIKSAVTDFTAAYNSLQSTITSLSKYDPDPDASGVLIGNATLRGVESRLRNITSGAEGEGDYKLLSNLGITLQLDGSLKVDDEKLDEAISGNLSGVSEFFAGPDGESGFSARMGNSLEAILGDKGLIQNATDGINTTLKRLDERYDRVEQSIDTTIARYQTQFAAMDSLVSQMNSTSTYLTQQFNAMSAQLKQ
ncbi:flagellar filament capping protein FliD [Halomonas shantousis]